MIQKYTTFYGKCLVKAIWQDDIYATKKKVLNMFYYPWLSITSHILTCTRNISSITISCKCSYRHVLYLKNLMINFIHFIIFVGQLCSKLNVLFDYQH
jgi:hypothetical protein